MPNQIFGSGLNGNIDAKIQRLKQHTGCPGVVDHNDGIRDHTAHGGNNRRNVVDFHGDGAWRFQKHDFSVWLQMLNDIGTNQRIKPRCRYAQFAEDFATEILTRFIGGVGHQHMIALFDKSKNGISNRCRPAGK
ncbi:Uncharacterised protein [Escherichia coli]|nr:Uncharacterised protein [Escherichia coli]